jgi:DNA-binding transcriptional LysR family regulator
MTKAAEQLNLVQPALSRAMKRLENELNTTLFDRKGKVLSLNENGKAFLQFANQCMNSFHKVEHQMVSSFHDLSGSLIVANMIENPWIYRAISAFSRLYPNIHIEFVHVPQTADFSGYHYFFGTSNYGHSYLYGTLYSTELWSEQMVLLVSRYHPLAKYGKIRLADAKDCTFVLPQETEYSNFIKNFFRLVNFKPSSFFSTNEQSMMLEMIRKNNYVAIMPEYGSLYGYENDFHKIKLIDPEYFRKVSLFWSSDRIENKLEQTFHQFIVDYFKMLKMN